MTISSTTNRVSYAGDDSTTAFSFPHRFLADADLLVILVDDSTGVETTQTLTTDYTVSGAGDAGGGTVTMVTAPATGETLVILNDPALTQGYDPEDGSALGADSFETAFDRLTLIAQRTRVLGERSFRFSDGVTSSASLELPSPVALRLFRWNTDADAIELVQVSDIGELAALADNEVMAKVPGSDADGIAIGANQFLGRLSGGNLKALTSEETRRVLDDSEHATDSATDTYVSATNTTPPADGVNITRDFQSANTTTTPTLDGKTLTTRDGSALWAGAVSGVHDVQYDSGADTYLVLEPTVPFIGVSLRDFGATGDGATDDTTAISSALSSGVSYIYGSPDDVYLITSRITPAAGQTLDLKGATLKMAGGSSFTSTDSMVELINDESQLINFDIDGNKANVSHSVGNTSNLSGILVQGSRVKVRHGRVHDCTANGYIIYQSAVTDSVVHDVESYDNGVIGFANEIPSQGDTVALGMYLSQCRAWGNPTAGLYWASGNKVRISDSDFEGGNKNFLYIGDAQGTLTDCTIANTRFSTTNAAVDPLHIEGEVQTGGLSGNQDTCEVELINCEIDGAGGGALRVSGGALLRYSQIRINDVASGIITENGGQLVEGRSVYIDGCSGNGMTLETETVLDGVVVKNWGASNHAIIFNGAATANSVARNLKLGAASGESGQHGVGQVGSPANIVIDGYNTFTGSGNKLNVTAGVLDTWWVMNEGTQETMIRSSGDTGGTGSAGAGNQFVEIDINGTTYKVLHDGTV